MAKIIVPVGFDIGIRHAVDSSETDHYEIVLPNGEGADLPADAYRVWILASADLQAHRDLVFTRERLVKLAAAGPETVEQAEAIVDGLLEARVLAEYEPGTPSAIEFLRRHRMFPIAEGMGSIPERPEMFRIGRNGEVLLEVFSAIYSVWALNLDNPSLWSIVEEFGQSSGQLSAEDIGYMFAQVAPTMVALKLGYLQPS